MFYKKVYNCILGNLYMISDGVYLTGLVFEKNINKYNNLIDKDLEIFDITSNWLDNYFKGIKPSFYPPYKINTTRFSEDVINIINNIPYGKTMTYGEIANIISRKYNIKKMSAQAVGKCVGNNPICIIIPCHRVIGSNGRLVGYGGGIDNKIKLLELEGVNVNELYNK